ncbi:MAG: MerR family transcriptional regulator [bacterium]
MKSFGVKKLYYSISEVSKLTEVEQYILRYWESEFEGLKPSKNRAGNRIYTNEDIKLILKIKRLVREEKYTFEGAKKILFNDDGKHDDALVKAEEPIVELSGEKDELKKDLMEMRNFLIELKRFIH